MSENNFFRFSNAVIIAPMCAVLLIWTVYYIELRFRINLDHYGIYPRTFFGLRGILLSPIIHGSLGHLYNNTLPLTFLTASLFYFYRDNAWQVLFWGIVLSGLITWLIGRPSYHIGASGVIYMMASFMFFKGIFTKYYRLVALSLIVVFIYGGLFWYIFPVEDTISWEGHLGGFIMGLVLAIKAKIPSQEKYDWEKEDYPEEEDGFFANFDAEGNFIETRPRASTEEENIKATYHYNPDKEGEHE